MLYLCPKKVGLYLSLLTLTACGGGSGGGTEAGADVVTDEGTDVVTDAGMEIISEFDPQNTDTSCDDRAFFNDMAGVPAIYFNGQIPVSKQLAGSTNFDWIYTYDFGTSTITVNRINDFGPGTTNNVYTLDELGRPITRVERIRNPVIQLDDRFDTQYTYDESGLVSSFTTNEVVNGVAVEPGTETNLTWTDVGGVSLLETPGGSISYEWDCTTLLSYTQVSNGGSPQNFTVTTVGSGQAVTVEAILEGQTLPIVSREFDADGNIVQGFGVASYEPTPEQVVNIELFENALLFGNSL